MHPWEIRIVRGALKVCTSELIPQPPVFYSSTQWALQCTLVRKSRYIRGGSNLTCCDRSRSLQYRSVMVYSKYSTYYVAAASALNARRPAFFKTKCVLLFFSGIKNIKPDKEPGICKQFTWKECWAQLQTSVRWNNHSATIFLSFVRLRLCAGVTHHTKRGSTRSCNTSEYRKIGCICKCTVTFHVNI